MPRHNKVCCGDFNPSNIIIAAGGMPCVLDRSHKVPGDANEREFLLSWVNVVDYQ